ncbi:MAG: hypothetical protein ACRDT2_10170 [Natronosporangium sp.]
MSLSPRAVAEIDQLHAHTATTLDELVASVRLMAADGMDTAERVALVTLALLDVLGRDPARLAGLAGTAILRLADQPDRGAR